MWMVNQWCRNESSGCWYGTGSVCVQTEKRSPAASTAISTGLWKAKLSYLMQPSQMIK